MNHSNLARRPLLLALVAASLLPPTPAKARPAPLQRYYALVFTDPAPGREEDFNRWYDTQHAPDVVSIPGFVNAQRYVRSDAQMRPDVADSPRYLVVYEIATRDLAAVYAEVNRRAANGRTRMSDTIARTGGMNVTYRATQRRNWATPGGSNSWLHIVMANPGPGETDALERWYARHHAPDMVALPGFTGYQLGVAAPVQMIADAAPRQRMALFAITAPALAKTVDAFRAAAPHMTPGPEMHDLWGFTYRPIGPTLSGDAVRKARAAAR
ncbi:hypothetical protein [Novosphingobium resinovorum]|uniref:hypothetical protein n=1 Tax=Novosphingobium resinovorum TaxID=158500 RepID=UPI002ED1C6A8|nr:hypothetical protein [Novosphingobium resinovorum]